MKTLTVGLPDGAYEIRIGNGLLMELGAALLPFRGEEVPVVVVTDENVWAHYHAPFAAALAAAGIAFVPAVFPAGETNKCLGGLGRLYDVFAEAGLPRGGLVVAFGGGVIGDLAGFAAATWMRGVRFVQVPTTLLAQVDSSVGGKTAVNHTRGKNLIGAFYQPKLVVIDPETLRTLPAREVRGGMAEVIKYGAIRSRSLFDKLDRDADPAALPEIIEACCRVKAGIVSRDERDLGERMLLNFGHTFGHAIERRHGYGHYTHGEAVAFGMVIAARLGECLALTQPGAADALRRLLARHRLEPDYPEAPGALMSAMESDKKSGGGGVRVVFLRRIGEAFTREMRFADLEAALAPPGEASAQR
ncbi:MAG: 3-dehydroquinate synthase [Oscillospiraceae bacterium]|nr:3-dehydroquinate synthase [Oscillospiraceae bacterium]